MTSMTEGAISVFRGAGEGQGAVWLKVGLLVIQQTDFERERV